MDTKKTLGQAIRSQRGKIGLSQEKLAEKANISYQYLSAVENGKENLSVGVLESLATALGTDLVSLVTTAHHAEDYPVVNPNNFIGDALLPPLLTTKHVEAVLNETHQIIRFVNTTLIRMAGRPLSGFIQRNNLSGIISNILCDSFSRLSPYKHNHDQKYPDLICDDIKNPHKSSCGLEVKTTIRPGKGGESHNGHSGWHVISCFELDEKNGDILFIHIMFANLKGHGKPNSDWTYVGSKVNKQTGSQRTETYVTTSKGTTKLRHGTVYLDREKVHIERWRTSPECKPPVFSPFQKRPSKTAKTKSRARQTKKST